MLGSGSLVNKLFWRYAGATRAALPVIEGCDFIIMGAFFSLGQQALKVNPRWEVFRWTLFVLYVW